MTDPRGYAHIRPSGAPLVDPVYPSKGVNSVVKPAIADNNLYCFDLAFTPVAAVGSPFINNSAVVAISTPPNPTLDNCPETHRDAAVKTYGSNTGTTSPDVYFQVVFV